MPPNASPKTHTSEAPADARRSGQARPPSPGCGQQPEPEPELDPDDGRRGLDGMVGPDGRAAVHEVAHPRRRRRRARLDDARREPERHRRLQLEEAVEDPEAPEADADDAAGRGLGTADPAREGKACCPWALSRRYCTVRTTLKAKRHPTTIAATTRSWWKSVVRNVETIREFPVCSDRPMPGNGAIRLPRLATRLARTSRPTLPPTISVATVGARQDRSTGAFGACLRARAPR